MPLQEHPQPSGGIRMNHILLYENLQGATWPGCRNTAHSAKGIDRALENGEGRKTRRGAGSLHDWSPHLTTGIDRTQKYLFCPWGRDSPGFPVKGPLGGARATPS